ncbi:Cna B-type domain-containing protein [Butyricicoccus sp. AF35-5AC]|uniref:leucine-rich repeat protein n=1 Tax=Butyricicoccus sp. AF35-5AC TaxID=2292003 RepID=UPI000E4BCA2A|nr:leucine-rich repeat protein [Butyricicoccus sp. AF35-5AC]RHP15994.1 Cna B-type domain-containing protein [Butyricicoccus sp. AF35-5AC]
MSKKFTRLLSILLSLNLTFGTGTFAAFAAEAEDGSTGTGYSESGDPAASAPEAEDSGIENTPDTSSPAPTESTGENAEPSVPSEPSAPGESASPSTPEAPAEAAPSAPAEKAPAAEVPAEEKPAEEKSAEQASVAAYAVTAFTQDSIRYDVSSGDAVVTGCADSVTKLVIPETVTYDDKEYKVVGIQEHAFDWANHRSLALETVDLGGLPLEIGEYAFRGQKSLTTVDGMDNITAIGNYMFTACSALTSVADLSKVTSVGVMAFMNCSSLTTLEGLNFSALTSIGQEAFNNMESFSLELGEHTFDALESLGTGAFMNMTGITGTVVLPESITEIPRNAFSSTGITGVDWSHITVIGKSAFSNCKGLTELHLPDSVTSIGESAFEDSGLTGELQLPSALTFLGTEAFSGTAISSVTFPSTLKNIGSYAFYSCSNLSGTLIIPEGVVSIGKAAFTNTGIEKLELADSVQTISAGAFSTCAKLTSVQIGEQGKGKSQLQTIDSKAFNKDTNITYFYIEACSADVAIDSNPLTIPAGVAVKFAVTVDGENIREGEESTLQQAVDAAEGNTTITANKSFIVDGTVTIPSGKTITLTDEGKGLSVVFKNGFAGPAFRVEQGAALILDGSFNFSCFRIANGSFAEVNGAMTLNGGTITRMSLSGSNMGAITVDGGSFTMGNGELSSISASSANCGAVYVKNGGKFAMNGGKITGCTFKNQYSGAVALADGNMTMTDGTISGNTASEYNAAGGVLVNGTSSLTMSGGTIADNTAKRGGGVCVRENGTFTMSGGTISGNSTAVDSATIQQPNAGGGGVFVEDNAAFEMTNGTITGNKTNGMGGGVATAVLSENDTVGGGRFHMTGGTISDNMASCGGGVYSWSGRDRVVLEGGNIVNNTAYRQGGGVYVSHAPWSITIKNALITANKAAIQGGGIWSCPVGTVSLGTDAAVFGNTAGKSADDAAFLLKWSEAYSTSFSGRMYGGGLVTWYRDTSIGAGDANYGAFAGDRYDAANPGAPVEPASGAIKGYGLKAVVSAESKALAETAPLKIMGNTAERGGGVGTNGEVIIPGEDTLENPVSLTVHKVWSGTSAYPTAVTVNLIRIAKDGTRTAIGTVLLSERSTDKDGKTWSYTFANLDGAYTYTVEEEAVDGFNISITGSMADGFTITNSKRSGGGGGGGGHHKPDPKPTPDPDPKPPVDIPDQPTPLDPLKPTENIPDGKVPTTKPETQTKTPDKTKAVNIPDSKTPTSSVPKTGDIGGLWAALCGLSAMGLAYFGIRRKHD